MSKFIEKISGSIEKTVTELNEKDFSVDPIAGTHFSKIVSVMSSAYKRHGFILEKSILERVKESEDFEAWEEKVFNVNRATENALNEIDPADRRTYNKDLNIEYTEDALRELQVDLITYNKKTKAINAYEIKRGNGYHDSGRKRSMIRDLLSVKFLLKSYGEKRGYEIKSVGSYIIFYYGVCSLKKPFSLTRDELDGHFSFPIVEKVEEVNEYFRKRLYSILSKT